MKLIEEKYFSWTKVNNKLEKTADKTLVTTANTGIPREIFTVGKNIKIQ